MLRRWGKSEKDRCLDRETCWSLHMFIDTFRTSKRTRHFWFTSGVMASKGGIASWFGNPGTSLYVTHHIRNYWTAHRKTLPLMWWYPTESHPLKGDIRFTERTITVHFCVRDVESLMFVILRIQNRWENKYVTFNVLFSYRTSEISRL